MPPPPRYFEDLTVGQVRELDSYRFTEESILDFARQWDPQPFHVDPDAAAASQFGGLIASGWHTAAVSMRLLTTNPHGSVAGEGSPGLDELRWLKPVRPGDVLTGRTTVLELRPSRSRPEVGIARSRVALVDETGGVVMTYIATAFVRQRQGRSGTAARADS